MSARESEITFYLAVILFLFVIVFLLWAFLQWRREKRQEAISDAVEQEVDRRMEEHAEMLQTEHERFLAETRRANQAAWDATLEMVTVARDAVLKQNSNKY